MLNDTNIILSKVFSKVKYLSVHTNSEVDTLLQMTIALISDELSCFQTEEGLYFHFNEISSSITSLFIAPMSMKSIKMDCFDLQRYPRLESMHMDIENCTLVKSFRCVDHQHIQTIKIGEKCFWHPGEKVCPNKRSVVMGFPDAFLQIDNNPLLETITIFSRSFNSIRMARIHGRDDKRE